MDPAILLQKIPHIVIIVVCTFFSGYFSATETAFSTFNKTRMKTLAEKGNKSAARVLRLSENYGTLISTILIGNNVVNILASAMATVLFTAVYGEDLGPTVATIVLTIAILIFGEVAPKNIAKEHAEGFSMFSAPLIQVLVWVFLPFNIFFGLLKKLLSIIFKSSDDNKMSQEELLMLVDEVEQGGSIDEDEGSLLRNVIEFTDRKAEEILTHRVDIAAFEIDAPKEEIAQIFAETKYSRLLVYEDSLDHVLGVLHQKDFYTATGLTDKDIKDLITPPFFIPQREKVSDLLKLFQQNQSHIAVVVDEYGGTVGLVTMEDVLEELVGEIWDEHDEVIEEFTQIEETVYRVSCDVTISDFCDYFDVKIESESTTLNGFMTEQLQKIAEEGDEIEYLNLKISVIETESHRATFVKVEVFPEELGKAEESEASAEEE